MEESCEEIVRHLVITGSGFLCVPIPKVLRTNMFMYKVYLHDWFYEASALSKL